ncbi:MAG: hypothetical protein ACD_45C00194G0002 [uncultured bacterium]|nr:MAG: hypothetical protein ACD_45C00194G0002 [uncultured bacterium]
MDSHVSVLIVGAGPTGLMMACELARRGIVCRIIDKKPERTPASNAICIQTRTLEIFSQMGLINQFLKVGHACHAINLYINGKAIAKLSLNHIHSTYPFVLMLPQHDTEKLLDEYLNTFHIHIERSVELITVTHSDHLATAIIRHADGQTETITTSWLIACDGANSSIREQCGLQFIGNDLTEQCVVADAKIDFSFMSKDEAHLFFDSKTLLAAFPLGLNKYRIAANLHLDYPRQSFTKHEVIEIVQERAHGNYYVTDVNWISPFWVHCKLANHMRQGPVFLAGDAAHIHSPAGGQGMNTGLQDAFNIAWKLALVVQGQALPSLLNTYEIERYPIAKEAVEKNDYFTKFALFDDKFLKKLKKVSEELHHDEAHLSKKFGEWLTQLDICYQHSPIIDYNTQVSIHSPQPGERAPDVVLSETRRLYHYFYHTKHTLLLLTGIDSAAHAWLKIKALKEHIDQTYRDLVQTYCISKDEMTGQPDFILDNHADIHIRYDIKTPTVYLIRPDGYIAYCSTEFNFSSITNVLNKYLC